MAFAGKAQIPPPELVSALKNLGYLQNGKPRIWLTATEYASMKMSIEPYLSFLSPTSETDLPGLMQRLRRDIPCERAILQINDREPIISRDDDPFLDGFRVTDSVWEKALETARGLVGFNQPGYEEEGPTGTLNVNCIRICLCKSFDDGDNLVRLFLDKRSSSIDFTESEEELLSKVAEQIARSE